MEKYFSRVFVGIPIELNQATKLLELQAKLKQQLPGPFTPTKPEKLHLTLHFLGKVAHEKMMSLIQSLSLLQQASVLVNIKSVGLLGRGDRRAVVLFIEKTTGLMRLHQKTTDILQKVGIPIEDRAYRPHITLGYLQSEVLSELNIDLVSQVIQGEQLVVYNSLLNSGGDYEHLFFCHFHASS